MDPNKLTQKSQEALHEAQNLAVQRGHQEVDAEHLLQESATWSKTRNTGDFALMVNPGSDYTDEPDIQLSRYISGSPSNSGRISDPRVDELFKKQAVETDPKKRIEMVKEIQKIIINNAYYIQGLWSARAVVHSPARHPLHRIRAPADG